ncbi:MAG: ATP-binding cassette domain-containing protein, partial [Eubacterium sp.]|nr:ATP-binding cassette domain-containing protein [Eubacterium sp.]
RMIAGLESITDGEFYIDGELMNNIEPKDRDIAMVFQNYALYPHMTVYDNMAFSLKLRKVPKDEIDEKVREAAKILDLDKLLDRKPSQLSGGQRQRVAMGRAIVRQPKVFLMDEPLSNLDAKLRVQMRIEISKIHQRLGATIIYVTHDQVEAMTLGTRIVVMKDGYIQQVDSPKNLYNKPCNLFVAGFIGSPQMNFFDAECKVNGGNVVLQIGNSTFPVPADKAKALIDGGYDGKTVILGIRPEDVREATPEDAGHTIAADIKFYELLGAEVYLYFDLEGMQMTARTSSSTSLRQGSKAQFALDMNKIHVFDKETEVTITN